MRITKEPQQSKNTMTSQSTKVLAHDDKNLFRNGTSRAMCSRIVRFADGFRAATSRYAVRRSTGIGK